jgi:hypothetical protein
MIGCIPAACSSQTVEHGAQRSCDPHCCIVQGPTQLYGEVLESPDIRWNGTGASGVNGWWTINNPQPRAD